MAFEVIQVIQEFGTTGGVERVAWELAQAFGRAGVENSVIAAVVDDGFHPSTKRQAVAQWVSWIPTRGVLRHAGRFVVVPLFTLAATLSLKDRADAVVLSHGDCLRGDVLVVHAVNAESLADKRRSGEWRWMLNPMHAWVALRDRWMIGGLRYRRYVAVSARVSTELQKHYDVPLERIEIIPNGIDMRRFRPDAEARKAIRSEFGVPQDARLLVFVGHEFHRKGLAHVVGALDLLGDDVWLIVVGSDNGAPYKKLAKRAGNRIVFAGSRSDVQAFYAAADAFVLPTSYETFSLVCMEAMACAVPVFAHRVGGIEDYLQDGINGYGIKMDAADIADKITRAFADETLMATMRAGAEATSRSYDWDEIAGKYLSLMGQVVAEKR